MSYPDNQFEQDLLEVDQYGGRDDGVGTFDGDAWTWLTGLVRSISKRFLSHVRVPWSNAVCVVQESVGVGDVLAVDLAQDATDPTTQEWLPFVQKLSTIVTAGGTPDIVGVSVATSAAGKKAPYATGGLLPARMTGLTSIPARSLIGTDPATSRMRVWQAGDDAIGMASPNGNVLLFFGGRVS